MITHEMYSFIENLIDTKVHIPRYGGTPETERRYALDLASRMYHCNITFSAEANPVTVFVINEKKQAALVDGIENFALAVATACALSYGWVDPNV